MAMHRFRFESLLDLARQREEQRMREVAALIARQQAAQDRLDGLAALREELTAGLAANAVTGVMDPARYGETVAYIDHLGTAMAEQAQVVQAAAAEVETARQALVDALQERRSLEILEERDAADAALAASRREDGRVDDLDTQRFARRGQGGE